MRIQYKNKRWEKILIGVNVLTAAVVTATFVMLFGFDEPLLPRQILYTTQAILLCVFIAEKVLRLFNAISKTEFLRGSWVEVPLLVALVVAIFGVGRWFGVTEPAAVR